MDPHLLLGLAFRIQHRHGDDWVTFDRREPHSPADSDPERHWGHGTIYACPRCDEQVRVVEEPEAPRG